MKIIFCLYLFFSLLIITVSSCRKNASIPDDLVSVSLHQCSEKVSGAFICFDSLVMDSRCPEGVECIWSGTAIAIVTFHESGIQHQFRMALKGYPGLGNPSDTVINEYKISFTDLSPYPKKSHPFPIESSKRATFRITQ